MCKHFCKSERIKKTFAIIIMWYAGVVVRAAPLGGPISGDNNECCALNRRRVFMT